MSMNIEDFIIESEYELLIEDLKVFNFLNTCDVFQREKYITEKYGAFENFEGIGVLAYIGDSATYISVLYDWNKNTIRIYHILTKDISDEHDMFVFIEVINEWLNHFKQNDKRLWKN